MALAYLKRKAEYFGKTAVFAVDDPLFPHYNSRALRVWLPNAHE